MSHAIRILGLDPSLVKCGWGIVEAEGLKIKHVAHGVFKTNAKQELPLRINELYNSIQQVIVDFAPDEAAVEDMFLKNNPNSAIKLGYARALCLLAPAQAGLYVGEYSAKKVKKSVVGTGQADKAQVAAMMNVLLPGLNLKAGDAADALAIAICHAHRASAAGALHRRFA
ncbi:MAG: crossover junction endodeoxyribonuclease RuvC [Robiginitomaculum sp.]|nr:MAG: crossover junction endodeoxyribonuclease RuvC [Robiginitomaculum sp.]